MRRSTTITLTLLAGAGLGLAYCHNEPDSDGVLDSEAACVARLGDDAGSECTDVFQAARQTHAETAPRFASAEECHAATGAECTALAPNGATTESTAASVFIPAMAGVMIGRALSDGTRGALPVYVGAAPPACQPGMPPTPGCLPPSSGGTGGGSGSGGSRYWYSGGSYAGSSQGEGSRGFRRASTSAGGEGLLSRGARSGSGSTRSGASASRSGGLGFSASAHSGGGS